AQYWPAFELEDQCATERRSTMTVAQLDASGLRGALWSASGNRTIPRHTDGYEELLAWLRGFGQVVRVGMEGTRSYGARLHHWLPPVLQQITLCESASSACELIVQPAGRGWPGSGSKSVRGRLSS